MVGKRTRFMATIERFGEKSAFKGGPQPTLLLKDVRIADTDELVADHLWFTKGKSWESFEPGHTIGFDARVSRYEKGYKGFRDDVWESPIQVDYRLERPTRIKKINHRCTEWD